MLKKIVPLIIFVFITAQLKPENLKRNWSDGKLSWDDFVVKQSETEISGFKYLLEYSTNREKVNDTIFIRYKTYCYIDQPETWATSEARTDQHLRYHQVVFNIAEMYRRILQDELDKCKSNYETDRILQEITNSCKADIDRFKSDSKDGQIMKTIVLWEQIVENKLNKNPEIKVPDFQIGDLGFGFYLGAGKYFLPGKINNHFNPSFNFAFGMGAVYKKSIFLMEGMSGNSYVTNDFTNNENLWSKGMKVSYSLTDLSYGYSVLDNQKFRIAPFVGLGIVEVYETLPDKTIKGMKLSSVNFLAGVSANYKFNKIVNLVRDPILMDRGFTENSILTKLYVTRTNFGEDMNGFTVNLSVSYNLLEKKIKINSN